MTRSDKIKRLSETLSTFTKTEIQEMGKVEKNPTKYSKISTKYIPVIEQIKELYPEAANFAEASSLARLGSDYKYCLNCDSMLVLNLKRAVWTNYCSHKCRANHKNSSEESIVIDSIVYKNFPEAIAATGLTRLEIRTKIFDSTDINSYWENNHDLTCLKKLKDIHPLMIDKDFLFNWKAEGKTITELAEYVNRERGTIVFAFLYFGIDTKHQQMSSEVVDVIFDREKFTSMFETMSIEMMAYVLKTSTSTITKYAREYELDTKRGYGKSTGEMQLYDFVKEIMPDALSGVVGLVKHSKLELDIYIPSLNIGIEYNGCYNHSTKRRTKNYHKEKVEKFLESNITYIQVWEDSWKNNTEVVKKFLKNKFGFNKRIGARLCEIKEIKKSEFDTFMNENHMQGTTTASIMIGLIYDEKLVSAIGFKNIASNISKISDGTGIELVRFANVNVSGSFTKLLNYFEKTYSHYDYITSFADLEIVNQTSNVYNKNGFIECGRIPPDYKYFDKRTKKREHKFNYRKSFFQKIGFDISNKTESMLAEEYGLLTCYDSGKIKYIKKIKR